MKAWVLNGIGDIALKDVGVPEPREGEILLQVEAAGICGSDIPRIYETGAHRMPLIPGHEFSGLVVDTGEGVSQSWNGKRVAVFPKIPCGKCKSCRDGYSDRCTDYDYVGSRRDGAFAEYVTAPADNLLELPDSVDYETAAMMEPMAVAANAFRTGCQDHGVPVPDNKTLAVCGLGTIGLMVTMFLREAGYENIFVVGNKKSQLSKAEAFGIPRSHFCDSSTENPSEWLKDVTGGGADVYFECVGSNESLCYGLEAAFHGGRVILVGNPRSDMGLSRDVYWRILRNQLIIRGIWNASFRHDNEDDWGYVLTRLSSGSITPGSLITHRFPLTELEKGFIIMRDKTEDYTKVMMVRK